MSKSRNYCAVDGCKSQKTTENLSFFKLPKEEERRKRWIEVIGRPDLLTSSTKPECHYVCSLHFDKSMIRNIPQLKADAVPTKLLPKGPSTEYKDVSTQTKESHDNILSVVTFKSPDTNTLCIKTESNFDENEITPSQQALSSDIPTKRKLHSEFKESEQKRKKLEHELNKIRKKAQSKGSE